MCFYFKQNTAFDVRISDWSSDVFSSDLPVLILLDEFARLGKAPVIASAFSYVAGYGLRLLPVIQSRSQPRGIYGVDVTDEIIANCGLEIVFTPKELKVANELSRSEEHTSELQSLMRSSYAVFGLK